jgi:hypothetical protein
MGCHFEGAVLAAAAVAFLFSRPALRATAVSSPYTKPAGPTGPTDGWVLARPWPLTVGWAGAETAVPFATGCGLCPLRPLAVVGWGGGHLLRFVPLETGVNGRCRLTGRYVITPVSVSLPGLALVWLTLCGHNGNVG